MRIVLLEVYYPTSSFTNDKGIMSVASALKIFDKKIIERD